MTTVFVPAEKVASLNLKFRFVDDPPNRKPRMGNICQIGIPHVRTPRKDYGYRDKKYHQ